jgi:hypothetical protein
MSQLETKLEQDRLVVTLHGHLTPEYAEEVKAAVLDRLSEASATVSVLFVSAA